MVSAQWAPTEAGVISCFWVTSVQAVIEIRAPNGETVAPNVGML